METSELGFNAWILIGNVLHAMLRGVTPVADGPGRDTLLRLDALLEPVQPAQMLHMLQSLPQGDRQILLEACIAAQISAGADVETSLGIGRQDAAPVLALLRQPVSL